MSGNVSGSSQNRIADWLRPHLRWITIPSYVLSAVLHVVLAGCLLFVSQLPSCRGDIGGDEGESFRDVGIHVRESPNETDSETDTQNDQETDTTSPTDAVSISEPTLQETPPVELSLPTFDLPPPVIGTGTIPTPSSLTTNDLLQPNTSGRPSGASGPAGSAVPGGTSFLGIKDVGKRFTYVIDRSTSMANDNALQAAKSELLASLARLKETQQFQIIFYSSTYSVLTPRDERFDRFWGTDAQRIQVSGLLKAISPGGGTRHLPAILRALQENPDAIFLLTDGAADQKLSAADLEQIKDKNIGGTHIHCIEFGRSAEPVFQGDDNFLVRLARQNQGQYIYRNIKAGL